MRRKKLCWLLRIVSGHGCPLVTIYSTPHVLRRFFSLKSAHKIILAIIPSVLPSTTITTTFHPCCKTTASPFPLLSSPTISSVNAGVFTTGEIVVNDKSNFHLPLRKEAKRVRRMREKRKFVCMKVMNGENFD